MKFLVDELPRNPEECPFSGKFIKSDKEYKMINTFKCNCFNPPPGTEFECRAGEYDFECPWLRVFKGEAFKHHYGEYGSVVGETRIPVYLD